MSESARANDLPIFSPRLDELMESMLAGEAPNVGRFCGYCYTPLGRKADVCPHCARTTSEYEPVAKIPTDFFVLYKRMRRRESIIVNSFAFAGLGLGLVVFIAMVAIAVYRYNASLWWMAAATVVLIVGGRVFAGILGGWIGDSIGYDVAQRKLAVEWAAYERVREARRSGTVPTADPAPAPGRA
ncbi:MAG TPA: zinc ribbon domain-containing protein [Dehalococcoidia bacterium]|jgi:hypothetical protein|nr:zinc ribbon domain-containing protein [Dehalococcoidia bacterium]